jgi:hypothetical protein
MKSIEGRKMINKMQQSVIKSGIEGKSLIKELQELRPIAIAEENPTLTKVIRLTYEHLEANAGFNIPLPADEAVDEDGEIIQPELAEGDIEGRKESFLYLLDVMANDENPSNREDLIAYRNMLMDY